MKLFLLVMPTRNFCLHGDSHVAIMTHDSAHLSQGRRLLRYGKIIWKDKSSADIFQYIYPRMQSPGQGP